MTQHYVTDPQGVKHIINAPDDATPEQIVQMAPSLIPPSSWEDAKASLGGGFERGAAATAMILPDLMNQAFVGPQQLYRGLSGREHDDSPYWKPFFGSEDVLQMLPTELRPHDPKTLAGHIAGLAGGIAGGVTAYGVGKGVDNLVSPFMKSGREQIANNLIASHADDAEAAAKALENVPEYVPGSKPTGGTASGDLGLIGTEKTLMQNSQNFFGERFGEQNTARTNLVNQVAGDETTIPRYTEMRTNATGPIYEQANQVNVDPKKLGQVLDSLDAKIAQVGPQSDAGRTLMTLKSNIQKTAPNIAAMNPYYIDPATAPIEDIPQSQLVQLYRETRDNLNKSGLQPGAYGSSVRGVIKPVNQQLGAALEAQNPKLAEANNLFEQLSVPIDQAKNMQTLAPRLTGGIQDLQGQNIFSPAKVGNLMKQGEMATEYNGVQPLSEALSPEQYKALQALNQDLQRSNAVNIPMVRPPGSNTFNNAASTSELTSSLAGKVAEHVPFFGKAYSKQNAKILQTIAEKMMNPETTREALLSGGPISRNAALALLLNAGAAGSEVRQ